MQYLRNNIGTPATNGIIPQGLPGFNNLQGYDYQPEKAKELIQAFREETSINQPQITISTLMVITWMYVNTFNVNWKK